MPPEEKNSPSTTNNPSETQSKLQQIRTFQGDVANALHNQKESLFSIQHTEELKRRAGGDALVVKSEGEKKRQELIFFILGSIFLIVVGLMGAWFGYRQFLNKTAPPNLSTPESRLIAVQSMVELNLASTSPEILMATIHEESSNLEPTHLKHFVLRKGVGKRAPLSTTVEFFTKLNTNAPGNLLRSFDPLFMLGSLGESRFLIIKITSFENAFPGMLSWESTMAQDLAPLFTHETILKSIDSESVFSDIVSRNKDARVLFAPLESAGTEPVLLYSFFDNRMLIITDSLETLRVLTERLTQELLTR